MASTYHSSRKTFYYADFDANGWPQTGRNRALRAMRKAFAFHIAGDQHLVAPRVECVADQALGTDCLLGSQCESGHCVDGKCCENACTGACRACNVAGSFGTCTNHTA